MVLSDSRAPSSSSTPHWDDAPPGLLSRPTPRRDAVSLRAIAQQIITFEGEETPPPEWLPGTTVDYNGQRVVVRQQWIDRETRKWNVAVEPAGDE